MSAAQRHLPDSPILKSALELARQGYYVFPVTRSKTPFKDTHGFLDATRDQDQIRDWFTSDQMRRANVAIATAASGILVIEGDQRHGGPASLDLLEAELGKRPVTREVRSGSGGPHLYFRHPGGYIKSGANYFGEGLPGLDVKADGGYVVAPPSLHQNGRLYELVVDAPVAELPPAWLDAIAKRQPKKPEIPKDALRGTEHYAGDGKHWLDWALDKKRDGTSDYYGQQLAVQLLVNRVNDPEHWLREYADAATYDVNWPFTDRDVARWLRSAEQTHIARDGQPTRSREDAKREKCERNGESGTGDTSHPSQFASSQRIPPGDMRPEAYDGLAGDIVRAIEPHTEADPRGVLVQILTIFGAIAGRRTCFKVGADRHHPNLYVVLAGKTASGGKGMSWGAARHIFTLIPDLGDWLHEHTIGGLSSGEGLIHALRDHKADAEPEEGKKRPEPEPLQLDKRAIVRESEFSSVLKMPARDGNTLSEQQRRAWDGDVLQTVTKNAPERATGAHVAIIGNITPEELTRYLSQTESANGLGNRYLWLYVTRSQSLPEGGDLDAVDLAPLAQRLEAAITFVRETLPEHHVMTRDPEARELWHSEYPRLTEGYPGLFGALTARAAPQVMRIAMIEALLDCSQVIRKPHLEAALAIWDYVEDAVRYIFGDALGDPVADTILRNLRSPSAQAEGLTLTDISDLFARHAKATELQRALELLEDRQLARRVTGKTEADKGKGRPPERWHAVMAYAPDAKMRNAKNAKEYPTPPDVAFTSHNSQFASSQIPIHAHVSQQGIYEGTGHLCSVTGGAHVYAKMRTADGRRVCVECDEPEGTKEAS